MSSNINALSIGAGTSGQVLTSTGAGTAPSFSSTVAAQHSFQCYFNSVQSNVTGDGTTVSPVIFDTETFDNGSAYDNTTGIWTVPATGVYLHVISFRLTGASGSNDMVVQLTDGVTNNFESMAVNYSNVLSNSGDFIFSITFITSLTLADAIHVNLSLNGGTKTVSIAAGLPFSSWSCVRLI